MTTGFGVMGAGVGLVLGGDLAVVLVATVAAVAIDLINTWDELEPEPDLLEDVTDLRTWLDWHGLSKAAQRMRESDLGPVRALRMQFDEVFDARDETEAADRLNQLARAYGTPPVLERAGPAWRLRSWPDEEEGLPAVAACASGRLLAGL